MCKHSATCKSTKEKPQKLILSQPKMHKNIMKNTRILHSCIAVFVVFLLVSDITKINAVPTDSSGVRQHAARQVLLHRALRDVATIMTASSVHEDHKDAATSTETTPDQPQGQCLLDGVLITRTSAVCEKQVGCRAIQKTGHCCPNYKCDCEKDGKTYLNGDKLVDPETPCTVCYCKGGEILCSSAVCFHRDDCTPRYIPGRCCPEYDNCPVANKTMVSSTPSPKPEVSVPASVQNPSITIKEITKPTEIRITDENKAKPIHQMLKTSTTTTTTTTSTVAPSTAPTAASSILDSSTTAKSLTLFKVSEAASHTEEHLKSIKSTNLETVVTPVDFHENRAESPISQELQRVDREQGNASSKVNIKREFMFGTTDRPLNGSYIEAISDLSSAELLLGNIDPDSNDFNGSLLQIDTDIDAETAGSDNIYHIILSTDGPGDVFGSSANVGTVPKLFATTEGVYPDLSSSTSAQFTTDSSVKSTDSTTEALDIPKPTESINVMSTTHHHVEEEYGAIESNPAYPSLPEDDFSIRDTNLPLSELEDTVETDGKDEQRSIGAAHTDHRTAMKTMHEHVIDSGSGSGSDVITNMNLSNDTDNDMYGSTTSKAIESKAATLSGNVQLMYSSEETSSAETAILNATDFKMDKIMRDNLDNETGSGDSLEIIGSELDGGSGSGSGSGEVSTAKRAQKQREPTTTRPTRWSTTEIDIDELNDGSGDTKLGPVDDPKLDAESLKVNEKDSDSIVETDPGAPKNGITSVKVDPTQDKTVDELAMKNVGV